MHNSEWVCMRAKEGDSRERDPNEHIKIIQHII